MYTFTKLRTQVPEQIQSYMILLWGLYSAGGENSILTLK